MFIIVFIDNFQFISLFLDIINEIKTILYTKFQIVDLGASSFYFRIEVTRD
jgi:hypothetical protein